MKTREQIISYMVRRLNPDTKPTRTLADFIENMQNRLTPENKELWDKMAEVFDKDIAPYMEFKKDV